MAEKRVVVETHLGVDHQAGFAAGLFDDAERVDFQQRGVIFPPSLVHAHEEFGGRKQQFAGESQGGGEFARLVGHQPNRGVDGFLDDFLWRLGSDGFDLHAPLGAHHHHRAEGGAIQQHGEVKFLFDVRGGFHQELAHDAAVRAGLVGHQRGPDHPLGFVVHFFGRAADLHAAFEAVFEGAFAAPSRVDL